MQKRASHPSERVDFLEVPMPMPFVYCGNRTGTRAQKAKKGPREADTPAAMQAMGPNVRGPKQKQSIGEHKTEARPTQLARVAKQLPKGKSATRPPKYLADEHLGENKKSRKKQKLHPISSKDQISSSQK